MVERNLIINARELKYNGVFRADELFRVINQAIEERGYTRRDKRSEHLVTPEGKQMFIDLRPFKVRTNYVTFMIKIKVFLDKITDLTEEVQGEKKKFEQGEVMLLFDAWLVMDYESRWTMKPVVYFLKGLINKYVYTFPLEGNFPRDVAADTAYIYGRVKTLLNSYKYEAGKAVKESDVMTRVAEEMGGDHES